MLRFYFFSPLSFHTFVSLKKRKMQISIIITISVIIVNVIITYARGMV
ncbi:hypothetical protein FlaCF_2489 [Flavobacterium tructae]